MNKTTAVMMEQEQLRMKKCEEKEMNEALL